MIEQKISKEYKFEASHILPNHEGKCSRLHGHSYQVVVEVTGNVSERKNSSGEGMIIDYAILDQLVRPIIDEMDHRHLMDHYNTDVVRGSIIQAGFDDWFYEVGKRTTAENLARHIFERVFTKEVLSRMPQLRYAKVTVKETVKTSASYGRGV